MPVMIRNYQGGKINSPHFFINILGEKVLLLPDPILGNGLPFWSIRNMDDLESYLSAGGHLHGLLSYLEEIGFENAKASLQRSLPNDFAFPSSCKILKHDRKYAIIDHGSFITVSSSTEVYRHFELSNCRNCNNWVNVSRVYIANFQSENNCICSNCISSVQACGTCEQSFLNNQLSVISGRAGRHCSECSENFHYCANCEEYHSERYCPNADLDQIQDHGYCPEIVPKGDLSQSKFPFYLGMELEMPTREPTLTLKSVRRKYGDLFWGVYDGSVDGVELVSQPATMEFWKAFDLSLHSSAYEGDAGIHLHACRSGFNHAQIMVMLKLFSQNKPFIKVVAERNEKLDQWAGIKPWEDYERRTSDLSTWKGGDKYSAINFCHSKTLEFRIFNSTKKTEKIHKNMEFICSLWDWSKNGGISGSPNLQHYRDFLKKSDYPNLKTFLETQGELI